jgi:hypothetical protein
MIPFVWLLNGFARWLAPPDLVIEELIRPPAQRYAGHDEAVRDRTAMRRRQAEAIKRDARKMECSGVEARHLSPIRRIR